MAEDDQDSRCGFSASVSFYDFSVFLQLVLPFDLSISPFIVSSNSPIIHLYTRKLTLLYQFIEKFRQWVCIYTLNVLNLGAKFAKFLWSHHFYDLLLEIG